MLTISSRQCHFVHNCDTIGFSSLYTAPVAVPKVESGEQVALAPEGSEQTNIVNCLIRNHQYFEKIAPPPPQKKKKKKKKNHISGCPHNFTIGLCTCILVYVHTSSVPLVTNHCRTFICLVNGF